MSVADNISFSNLCQFCDKMIEVSDEKKIQVLQSFMESWKGKAKEFKKSHPDLDDSFYPVLRLLLPQLDRERGNYGVKEHTLARIYIRILSLPKDSRDALKLLDFRASKNSSNVGGDFADVAFWILKRRCGDGGQLSIKEINDSLNSISLKHSLNEPRGVEAELISLLKKTSAEEQKWLIRIILKEMKLKLGQNIVLRTYHPDAKNLYDASNSLKKVCEVLKNSSVRLHEVEIELFTSFKPMLSEECDIKKIDAYLKKSRYFYIETKLDGERFQLHKREENYKYFSRNGNDYTSNFGSTVNDGNLTPYIAEQFRPNVRSCILDGEMMSWNLEKKAFASKAKNIDVKNLKDGNIHQPCFCVFDILLYNDEVLTNKPLNYRIDILNEIIDPLEGRICFVTRKRISSNVEVLDSLNEAIDNREEGIVMKEFLSVYKPNMRKNGGWYKIKPEYTDGLSDTLDFLIIGGYFGSGRHKGKVSHFLLGVAVDTSDDRKIFYSTARVGSGYSMDELGELQNKLQPHWNVVKIGEMPPDLEWTKERPDLWIEPKNSLILEVKAAEITCSNLFRTGFTLRFPRVEKIRYDKSWKDCLTLEELEEKQKMASGKLAFHHLPSVEEQIVLPKKKPRRNIFGTLPSHFKSVDTSNVEVISSILAGKEICVLTGFEKLNKCDVELKILEFGGTIVQNPGKNTFCVLAENDSTVHIKNVIKYGSHDVLYTSWFYSQLKIENKSLPGFAPKNFVSMSEKTRKIFSKLYDEYGDHYTELSTRDTIQWPMAFAKRESKDITLKIDEIFGMDLELFSGPSLYGLFRLCVAYFDRYSEVDDSSSHYLFNLEFYEVDFKFYGGRSSNCLDDQVTHVIVCSRDLSRLEEINRIRRERNIKFHIATEKWIESSIKNKSLSKDFGF